MSVVPFSDYLKKMGLVYNYSLFAPRRQVRFVWLA